MIMGHEAAGIVEKTGNDVTQVKVGDRVTPHSVINCGKCIWCNGGRINLCREKKVLGVNMAGCYAEYFKVKEPALFKIPDELSYEKATLTEPFSVGLHAVAKVREKTPQSVLIIGAGTIGLMVLKAAGMAGIEKIYIADIDAARLNLAEMLGGVALDISNEDLRSLMKVNGQETGVDVVFDAVGMNKTFMQAVDIVNPAGEVILIGMSESIVELNLLEVVSREINISGAYISAGEFKLAIDSLTPGFENIIGLIKPFYEAAEVFNEIADSKVKTVKAVLVF